MPGRPLVSIIILCYNYGHFLAKAVDSALGQTLADREVIVVDNGSTDNTQTIIESYGDSVIGLRLKENAGRSGGKNAGLGIARGKYIQFLDADDTLWPEKLERQVRVFEENEDIDVVYSDSIFVNERIEPMEDASKWYRDRQFTEDEPFTRRIVQECFLLTHDGLIRKTALDAIGGFDASRDMLEDWDLWLRLAVAGYKFYYLKETLANYYFHQNSLTKDPRHSFTLRKNFVYKHLNDPATEKNLGKTDFLIFQAYQHRILASNLYNLHEWAECRRELLKAFKTGRFRISSGDLALYFKSLVKGMSHG